MISLNHQTKLFYCVHFAKQHQYYQLSVTKYSKFNKYEVNLNKYFYISGIISHNFSSSNISFICILLLPLWTDLALFSQFSQVCLLSLCQAPRNQQYQTNDEAWQWEITHLMQMSRPKFRLMFYWLIIVANCQNGIKQPHNEV